MNARRLPRLSLDLLRGFRAAARHLSFTRAAQELFVTQSAISREVRTLEEQIGKPLFRRVNRTLQLTEAGQELYAAADDALTTIDEATTRISGGGRTLAVTTTVALASTWLVPRLPRFAQLHPEIDLRLVASNDALDLEREGLDLALRYVPRGAATRSQDKLFDYKQFPVCSPALARDRTRVLRSPADLSRHVLIDFETTVYGRPWYDWRQWLDEMKLRGIRGAGWFRFSHYDQVIEAAIEGSGVAIGKLPHLSRQLCEGVLVAPLGEQWVATPGTFRIEPSDTGQREIVDAFVDWLRMEARSNIEAPPAPPRARRPAHADVVRAGAAPRRRRGGAEA